MRIDRIELYHVGMPLIYPWRTAYGEDATIESVLVRMSSGSLDAWGESSPLAAPCYSPEFAGGVFQTVCDWLAPRIIGQDIASGDDLQRRLAMFKGNPFAKAALDTAWWNLHSLQVGKPLHKILGATRDVAEVGADFGVMDSVDELLPPIGAAVAAGFPRIKLKFRPGWDLPMLAAVRKQFPDHPFHIDCNSGYSIDDLATFQKVDEFRLEMIEQPLAYDDLTDHAKLQRNIQTAVCLDESICSLDRVKKAIELQSCRYVNIKPGRVGGLTVAKKIHDACQQAGIPCWVGGMLESAVGQGLLISLSMLDNFKYPADIFPTSRFYHEDLGDPPVELVKSPAGCPAVAATQLAGNASRPVAARLQKCTLQTAAIKA